MPWLIFPEPVECRAIPNGRCVIPAGAPVWQHTTAPRIVRCAAHAPEPVDDEAVDAARHALESEGRTKAMTQLKVDATPGDLFDARMAAADEGGQS